MSVYKKGVILLLDDKAKKVTITLKPDVLVALDKLAEEWGTNRSVMIAILVKLRMNHDHFEEIASLKSVEKK